jgi:adenylate kinase
MKLLFIGPQGSGKGTQAKIVSEKLGIPHISTGDLLRSQTDELLKEISSYINRGRLFPDERMLELLKVRLEQGDCSSGYILDGFPRNKKQAEMLDKITSIDAAVEIYIPDEESVRRISGRRSCLQCGRIYNLITKPVPKIKDVCDEDRMKLVQRADDHEEAVRIRLATYHRETEPVLRHYHAIRIDGTKKIEEVTSKILSALKTKN